MIRGLAAVLLTAALALHDNNWGSDQQHKWRWICMKLEGISSGTDYCWQMEPALRVRISTTKEDCFPKDSWRASRVGSEDVWEHVASNGDWEVNGEKFEHYVNDTVHVFSNGTWTPRFSYMHPIAQMDDAKFFGEFFNSGVAEVNARRKHAFREWKQQALAKQTDWASYVNEFDKLIDNDDFGEITNLRPDQAKNCNVSYYNADLANTSKTVFSLIAKISKYSDSREPNTWIEINSFMRDYMYLESAEGSITCDMITCINSSPMEEDQIVTEDYVMNLTKCLKDKKWYTRSGNGRHLHDALTPKILADLLLKPNTGKTFYEIITERKGKDISGTVETGEVAEISDWQWKQVKKRLDAALVPLRRAIARQSNNTRRLLI